MNNGSSQAVDGILRGKRYILILTARIYGGKLSSPESVIVVESTESGMIFDYVY